MAVRLMTIHVRNAALKKVGEFTAGAYSVTFREALNAPGGWVLSAPADHPSLAALLEPGAGLVIVTDEGDQFGGYVSPAGAGHCLRRVGDHAFVVASDLAAFRLDA